MLRSKLNKKINKSIGSFKRQLADFKIKKFQPKIEFTFDFKNYTLKTVSNLEEFVEVLGLRHEVFKKSYDIDMKYPDIDFDKYDTKGDHIILIDKTYNKIEGTYRLLCSKFTDNLYTESEFSLETFKKINGVKLELGRACVHEDYRNGTTISLIWRGLARYLVESNADYLMGVTSVHTTKKDTAMQMLKYLQPEGHNNPYSIKPKGDYLFFTLDDYQEKEIITDENVASLMPPLMKSYISAGAKVQGLPALDKDFNCTDYFTILDMENLNPSYHRRYIEPWINN